MSIMDGQLNDLGPGISDDPDLIQQPNQVPAIKEQATLVPAVGVHQGEGVKLAENYEKKLPMMDIQFKLVEGQTAKIADMQDVVNQITTSGSVDQQSADDVNVVFENFFSETLSRGHFTATPSKINLDKTTAFMQKRISQESIALAESIVNFSKEPLTSMKCMLVDVSTYHLDKLYEGFGNLKHRVDYFIDWMDGPEANTFTQVGKQMIDMRKIDLIEQGKNPEAMPRVERFEKISKGLAELFKDKSFGSYVRVISLGKNDEKMSEAHRSVEYGEGDLNLLGILDFYKSFDYYEFTEALRKTIQDTLVKIEQVQASANTIDGKGPEECRTFYANNASVLAELNDAQKRVYHFVYSFLMFNTLADQLLDCYEQ